MMIARVRRIPLLLVLAAVAAVAARSGPPGAAAGPTANGYALVQDVTTANFARMVDFALIPGITDEAVVVSQKEAVVRRVSLTGAFTPAVYGNLSDRVDTAGNEEGLLSIAFSPDFVNDGRVYVYYTALNCDAGVSRCSRISRFPVDSSGLVEASETEVLEIEQLPSNERNHNGGRLLFGPDGYLYLSIGDGGGGGDPEETGQDNTDLLGSVLRIKVTGETTYSVPADNPFVGVAGDDRVWAYGLRNPWRYSFDRVSGELWLGDVGQGSWEEVEEIAKGGNYGWDCWEGEAVYENVDCPPANQVVFPRETYPTHEAGSCAVTGGYVYRGTALHEIYGWYVYGDYCSGRIWAVNPADNSDEVLLLDSNFLITSFGELPNGELLVLTFANGMIPNAIYRLTCAAMPDTDGDQQGNACDLDDDSDGFSDTIEAHAGTDPLLDCGTDAWPADITNDGVSDISDIVLVAGSFGKAVPPAPARHDIAPDPPDGVVDISDVVRMAGLFGQGCT